MKLYNFGLLPRLILDPKTIEALPKAKPNKIPI